MIPNDFGDALTFCLVPLSGQDLSLTKTETLVIDKSFMKQYLENHCAEFHEILSWQSQLKKHWSQNRQGSSLSGLAMSSGFTRMKPTSNCSLGQPQIKKGSETFHHITSRRLVLTGHHEADYFGKHFPTFLWMLIQTCIWPWHNSLYPMCHLWLHMYQSHMQVHRWSQKGESFSAPEKLPRQHFGSLRCNEYDNL